MKSKLFKVLSVLAVTMIFALPAYAQDGGADAWKGYTALGAGIAIGLAVLGSGLGQGRAASSALEGMARNPQAAGQIQTGMLLALAFPESLVLFAFAIAFFLQGKF